MTVYFLKFFVAKNAQLTLSLQPFTGFMKEIWLKYF